MQSMQAKAAMGDANEREQAIFDTCISLPPAKRRAYLNSACGNDPELRSRMERLLAAHAQAEQAEDDRLDRATAELLSAVLAEEECEPSPDRSPESADLQEHRAGETIGGYRLVRKLGEGGMASVWLAGRSGDVHSRPVAIKLPHGGWPQSVLIERMAREHDVLANLNHPNIARLWDAGLTTDGQPWLALEYVEGKPITEYCRMHNMSVAARVELFLQVTTAISYAHNNLVVHRDLKPWNILVTDEGEVRVLDFGIAKLLEGGATRESELTRCSGLALTLDYASPEQVLGKPLTVVSDLYSLGVILYELLTGARPYRHKRPSRAALEDAIVIEEPYRPSDVVTDPGRRRRIRGDLDTIVLKALKKDVSARYATVAEFAEDLVRYLQSRPVFARPDNLWYRFCRFVRRHRFGVAAGAAFILLLMLASIALVWQARITLAENERAEAANAFLISILLDAHSYWSSGKPLSAVDLLKDAAARISSRTLPDLVSRVAVLNIIGAGLLSQHELQDAESVLEHAVRDSRSLGDRHPMALRARLLKSWCLLYRGDIATVRTAVNALLNDMNRSPATLPEDLAGAQRILSAAALEAGDNALAEAAAREALHVAERRLNPRHNQSVLGLVDLCYAQLAQGDSDARDTAEAAVARGLEAYGGSYTHPNVLRARVVRAQTLAADGNLDLAITETSRAIEDASELFNPSARVVGVDLLRLSQLQLRAGRVASALSSADRAREIMTKYLDSQAAGYAFMLEVRGSALLASGRLEEAGVELDRAESLFFRAFGHSSPATVRVHQRRLAANLRTGR